MFQLCEVWNPVKVAAETVLILRSHGYDFDDSFHSIAYLVALFVS